LQWYHCECRQPQLFSGLTLLLLLLLPPLEQQIALVASHDVVRIAIGTKVFRHDCKITVPSDGIMELSYKVKDDRKTHTIKLEEMKEVKYFCQADENGDLSKKTDEEVEPLTFISMRVTKTKDNGLDAYSNVYKPSEQNQVEERRHVVVEFRSDAECDSFLESIREFPTWIAYFDVASHLEPSVTERYSMSLVNDSKKEAKRRSRKVGLHQRSGFLAGRKDDEVLVCYPFPADSEELDAAANGLGELSGASLHGSEENSDSREDSNSTSPGQAKASSGGADDEAAAEKRRRAHYLEIRVEDFERLEPGEFLNDTLIDFFMQW
jgi:hypothetical protein